MSTGHDNYPREQYQTQAPIGATSAGLAASIALGRLLRMAPHADVASIHFEIRDQGDGAYAGPGPYVIASAAEPDECPSCHTIAGQHPHTEYCRRMPPSLIVDMPPDVSEEEAREFADRFSAVRSQPATHRADLWPGETPLDDVIRADLAGNPADSSRHHVSEEHPTRHIALCSRTWPVLVERFPGERHLCSQRLDSHDPRLHICGCEHAASVGQTSQPATRTSQPPTQHRGETGPVAVININGEVGPDLVDKVSQAIREAQRRNGRGH
ncbi:hypothetical protein ABZX12_18545 [Kribbella sp. NPDC003505]|uniref:hypothetical protein n=1 Tax=Kribbella sp. NPDC003505 TaxID=3154448 RepID=UPI0033BB71E3